MNDKLHGGGFVSTTNFNLRVRTELLRRGMSLRDLAKLIEVSPDYMSKILTGRRKAPARRIQIKNILHTEDNTHEKQEKVSRPDDPQGWDNQDYSRSELGRKAG